MQIDLLVEGLPDEAAAQRLLTYCELEIGTVFGKRGASYIRQKLAGFSQRVSQHTAMLVLIDFMDIGIECERNIQKTLLPHGSHKHCLVRGVVREIESWALADTEGMRTFLGVSVGRIPRNPEGTSDPKLALINLARFCRNRHRRTALVPADNTSASIGPGYTSEMVEFFLNYWDPERARLASPSLNRCMLRLTELKASLK